MNSRVTKVRKIGNSKGILLPRDVLDEGRIVDYVKITVKNKVITITPGDKKPKSAWSDFKRVKREKQDLIINKFDSKDWEW